MQDPLHLQLPCQKYSLAHALRLSTPPAIYLVAITLDASAVLLQNAGYRSERAHAVHTCGKKLGSITNRIFLGCNDLLNSTYRRFSSPIPDLQC